MVNHENFVIFSFLRLRYIRGTYSKYFQIGVSEALNSSATQKLTTWCYFPGILYTFHTCNKCKKPYF